MKVLVIDDEPLVRLSIRRAFEMVGHTVIEAEDGVGGVQVWSRESPDVVFLDILMPGLSGPQVLQEMGPGRTGKVLLMSAYSGDYDLKKAKEVGADDFIAKPFADIFAVVKFAERLNDHRKR